MTDHNPHAKRTITMSQAQLRDALAALEDHEVDPAAEVMLDFTGAEAAPGESIELQAFEVTVDGPNLLVDETLAA